MATVYKNHTFHILRRELLTNTTNLSIYSAAADVLRTMITDIPEITATMVHGTWQNITESPVPDTDDVLQETEGLSFLTIRYATTTNQPIINCPECGDLMVKGGRCHWQDDHEQDTVPLSLLAIITHEAQ